MFRHHGYFGLSGAELLIIKHESEHGHPLESDVLAFNCIASFYCAAISGFVIDVLGENVVAGKKQYAEK